MVPVLCPSWILSAVGYGLQGRFGLLWGRGELSELFFCVSCREGLVAMHEFTEQPRAAAIVMSAEGCHVTALSAGGFPGARKASASRAAVGALDAGGSPRLSCSQIAAGVLLLLYFLAQSVDSCKSPVFPLFPCTVSRLVQVGVFSISVSRPTDSSSTAQTMERVRRAFSSAFSLVASRKAFRHLAGK